jgi:hypothetical protein
MRRRLDFATLVLGVALLATVAATLHPAGQRAAQASGPK